MAATRKRPAKTMPPELVFIDGLEVWLTRKAIKNMHLRVKPPDGRIEVSAPLHLPLATIRKFVGEKRDWIERHQPEIAQSPRAVEGGRRGLRARAHRGLGAHHGREGG